MSDTTVADVTKMKVVDLRKELKSRGLSYAGDKAELVGRLQAALSQDDHGDINLDSDEIDSDGVLDYEDEKSQTDILEDTGADTVNEELALAEQSPEKSAANGQSKPQKTLKRKLAQDNKEKITEKQETKDPGSKKIVLNRNISMSVPNTKAEDSTEDAPKELITENSNKVKITADLDPKARLEMRAKRFGLPVKVSDAERKEARKQRFGQNATSGTSISTNVSSGTLATNMEKLKKRAERFGQSVSAIMTDIENKEKLEKRKAKFSTVK